MAAYSTTSRGLSAGLKTHPTSLLSLPPLWMAPQLRLDKAAPAKPLWLCVYFTELPLEAAGYPIERAQPFAIFEESSARRLVYATSTAASVAGITRGMWLSQAYALCPTLKVVPRDTTAEMNRLHRLAAWAGQFTPMVSLQPPQALLLEISGSLRLFGGLDKLKKKLSDGICAQSRCAHVAITPAPLASLLLASQGQTIVLSGQETLERSGRAPRAVVDARGAEKSGSGIYRISKRETSRYAALARTARMPASAVEIQTESAAACSELSLRSALGKLPIDVLPLEADSMRRLARMGVKDLHDLWRLPRQGLARRFGPELLDFLDRAVGLKPDPRRAFHPPHRFIAELELPWETDDTAALLEAARRLFTKLVQFLRERDGVITRLRLTLHHAQSPPSRLEVGLRDGARDEQHLLSLLEEHLHRFQLPATVCKLRLTTPRIQPFTASDQTLFARHRSSDLPLNPPFALNPLQPPFAKGRVKKKDLDWNWRQVLDQLRARLGNKAVGNLRSHADHRPEWTWDYTEDYTEPGQFSHAIFNRQRPLWLLSKPRPLTLRQGRPWRRGLLSIVEGPERIESGWWDGRDIGRDYYLAKDTDSSRLWIFHDLHGDRTWYLHGLFG